MKPVVAYVYAPLEPDAPTLAQRFVQSYLKNPPSCNHTVTVILNGPAHALDRAIFTPLPKFKVFQWDDSGWDIGGFLALAKSKLQPDTWLCCQGGPSHFPRAGWLKRLCETVEQFGPGLYGTLGTYEVRPHLNTSGFFCPASLLAQYPAIVVTRQDRYTFEHGNDKAFWLRVLEQNLPVKLVTWDGVYDWQDWRKPPNIYRRGDQSNCLTWFRHTDNYFNADPATKQYMGRLADTLTDPHFIQLRYAFYPPAPLPAALPPLESYTVLLGPKRILGCIRCGQQFGPVTWSANTPIAQRPRCPACESAAAMPIDTLSNSAQPLNSTANLTPA